MFPTTLPEMLRAMADRPGPAVTFVDHDGAVLQQDDGASLVRKAARVARGLLDAGHRRGDRVLLAYSPDAPGFMDGFWGTVLAGCVPVPVSLPDPRAGAAAARTFRHIAADCGATTALADRKVQALMTVLQGKDRVAGLVGLGEAGPALTWRTFSGSASDADGGELLHEAIRHTTPDDLAFLQYTSGSTSEPRGVRVRHRNVVHNVRLQSRGSLTAPGSVLLGWVPLYHDMGLSGGLLHAAFVGCHFVFFSPFSFLRNPELWLDLVPRYGVTHTAAPDFGYRYLLKHATPGKQWDLRTLVGALQGGEPMRPDTARQIVDRFGPSGFRLDHFLNAYGMAETVLWAAGRARLERPILRVAKGPFERGVIVPDPDGIEVVSCGTVDPELGSDILAVDPETRVPLGSDRVGELWLTGPSVADGYWGRSADENRERFGAEVEGDDPRTFLRTGDLGFVHDGQIYVCGRRKDMIILAGRNLYPQDLEATIHEADPSIRRGCVAVVGLPADPDERIGVLVEVKQAPADASAVVQRIQAALAHDHRLGAHAVALVKKDTLPKTSSGKLRRSAARDAWLAGSYAPATYFELGRQGGETSASWLAQLGGWLGRRPAVAPPAAPASPASPEDRLREHLRGLAAAQMGVAPGQIDVDAPLADQGFDSVRLLAFAEAAGGMLGVEIHPNAAMNHPTLRSLARHLAAPRAAGLLTPLRASGSEPPLVLLPPIGGHTLWAMDLVRELRPSLPVWAFVAPEHVDGHPAPETVDAQVAAYVAELLATVDAPSFRIGGYSLGSTLAIEAAWQLVEAGRRVDGVVLLGGALVQNDGPSDAPPDPKRMSVEIARQLGVPGAMMGQFEKMGFEGVIAHFAAQMKAVTPGAPEDLGKKMMAAAKGAMGRTLRWTPRPVGVPVVMLRPEHGDAASDAGWARLASGGFEVVLVPGDHSSMIRKPHAEALARAVEATLDRWNAT